MSDRLKVVLFTEVNSKLGSPFLRVLSAHPLIDLVAVVTSPNEVVCHYFVNDEKQVDVEIESQALGIDVLRPRRVGDPEVAGALKRMEPDYFIVANFQQLLRSELLFIPRAINFHPSPLPRYAGLAPFFWIVCNGDRRSAISVIKMDEGLDTGPIIMQRQFRLTEHETSLSLRTFQEKQNVLMLLDLIPSLASGSFTCVPQDLGNRTYYGRPTESELSALLDFGQSAHVVLNHVRAGYRHPGAHFFLEDGTRVVVLSATLVSDCSLRKPQLPGRILRRDDKTYVAAADHWLQLLTVEVQGVEAPVAALDLPDTCLETSEIPVDSVLLSVSEQEFGRSISN
ncbi:MAG: Methionyl-tRNA formyltransferase related protein [uncultured Caballeronia sp.]|nr:MAG: Methionyl-tRNA formyltransferase related protein [uncultured Caballeronia sp.]